MEYDYFLLIAEEMNISKAAKRAYISQQSLSKYLHHLEEKHGTLLFERKPRLALTPAGEVVLQRARQMKVIATNLQSELEEIKATHTGTIVFAGPPGRVATLLPMVFPAFRQRYPNVRLVTKMGMTKDLLAQTANGAVDVLLSVGAEETTGLEEILLDEEPFYLAVSDDLLMQYFPEEYPDCKLRFMKGVDLREFVRIPFMENTMESNFKRLVDRYLKSQNIQLTNVLSFDDGGTYLKLASLGCGVCFFPSILKRTVYKLNKNASPYQRLNYFPLKDMKETNRICILYGKRRKLPAYTNYFIQLVAEQYKEEFLGGKYSDVQDIQGIDTYS